MTDSPHRGLSITGATGTGPPTTLDHAIQWSRTIPSSDFKQRAPSGLSVKDPAAAARSPSGRSWTPDASIRRAHNQPETGPERRSPNRNEG